MTNQPFTPPEHWDWDSETGGAPPPSAAPPSAAAPARPRYSPVGAHLALWAAIAGNLFIWLMWDQPLPQGSLVAAMAAALILPVAAFVGGIAKAREASKTSGPVGVPVAAAVLSAPAALLGPLVLLHTALAG